MVRQISRRQTNPEDAAQDMPVWAGKLIESFDRYSTSIERSLNQTFDRVFSMIDDLLQVQETILSKLAHLESKLSRMTSSSSDQRKLLYSTMVKIRADSQKIDDKLRTIAWVGINEKHDENSTRMFDRKIVKEVVYTSGCDDLIREFDDGRITFFRRPVGKPRASGERGRIIKITLPNQALRDSLLAHEEWATKPYTPIRSLLCKKGLHYGRACARSEFAQASGQYECASGKVNLCR
ncbi:hypothetical protein ANCDUO_03512 [Ancylostoma duodenale]|uniref:Uncharacterized protein n=1 Tax=Ancylostoma duodenale TaxID=51022 RepID=A0A0C2D8V0_9BILA|nr:hypothetical protein ANCDUO_03512 [Ancylostoma duodenale]